MKDVKPVCELEDDGYYAVTYPDGTLHCSCGATLVKMDEKTYECPGGYPVYRFDEGDILIDKFGNLMFRNKSHDPNKGGKKK